MNSQTPNGAGPGPIATISAFAALVALLKEGIQWAKSLRKENTRRELTHSEFFDELSKLRESCPEAAAATGAFAVTEVHDGMHEIKIVLLDGAKKPVVKANGDPVAIRLRTQSLAPALNAFFGDQRAVMIE